MIFSQWMTRFWIPQEPHIARERTLGQTKFPKESADEVFWTIIMPYWNSFRKKFNFGASFFMLIFVIFHNFGHFRLLIWFICVIFMHFGVSKYGGGYIIFILAHFQNFPFG